MLNKAERFHIFKVLRIYSIIALLPTQVDIVSGRLSAPSRARKRISALFYSLFILDTLYKDGSLAYVYLFVPDVPLHQLVIHFLMAMASTVTVFWYYSSYVRNPTRFFTYANMTLHGNIGGPVDPKDELKRHWTVRVREYSLQDLIAMYLPYMGVLTVFVISASMVFDSSMKLLVYAALPSSLQNRPTFGLCLLEEIRVLVVIVDILTPVWQLQVISFELVSNQLRLLMQNGRQSTRDVYGHLRCLQLYVTSLNNLNSFLIFTCKLICISGCIISGYAAIAHFRDQPVFGIMYYVILSNAALIYAVVYQKAFNIPQLFGQVASYALLHNRGNQRHVLRRQILSIPRTGISVGSFHKMERESTLNFMNFVVGNIVNMLVAYG